MTDYNKIMTKSQTVDQGQTGCLRGGGGGGIIKRSLPTHSGEKNTAPVVHKSCYALEAA